MKKLGMTRSNSLPVESPSRIEFVDLAAQQRRIGPQISRAIERVLDHGQYILGPEVQVLEETLASFCGTKHCVTCANGTDALRLVLQAWEIGPGDAVFVPSFTFAATAEAVCLVGATPVFCDVTRTDFNLDPGSLVRAIPYAREQELVPRAVIAVDLYGQPANHPVLESIADDNGLLLMVDAAQSFGASVSGRRVGGFGKATATSFFPSKPLGCYGDGGAIFTNHDDLAVELRSLRAHGRGKHKYTHERVGTNSRLDTLQAAILIEKLAIFPEELLARQDIANRYSAKLQGAQTPNLTHGAASAWAQYTIVVDNRDEVARSVEAAGIPTAVHYPLPLPKQPAFAGSTIAPGGIPVSEWLAAHVLSLPMHPYLSELDQDRIVQAINEAISLHASLNQQALRPSLPGRASANT
jgi:dTDP-4-amino-4,6-dideoxygalactose transaminase